MRKSRFAFGLLVILPALAWGNDYNAADEFSPTLNPNGVWKYGRIIGGAFTAFPAASTIFSGASTWNGGSLTFPTTYPLVYHNGGTSTLNYGTGTISPNELGAHPGPQGELAAVGWTAPAAGVFRFTVTFTSDDSGRPSGEVFVNQTSMFAQNIPNRSSVSFIQDIAVTAGDVVFAAVGNGVDSNFGGDTTQIHFAVSVVPELPCFALFGLGIFALARLRGGPTGLAADS